MILPYTKIVGLDVFDLKNQSKVGVVKDIVIQKKDFKISGIILENSIFNRDAKVVSHADIVDISTQGVVIRDSDAISSLKENVRIGEAIKEGMHGIGQKVVTKSGKSLGRVVDLFILSETLEIPKFYVKNIFGERIIARTAIVDIEKRKIIVKENFETEKASMPEISTSLV